MKLTAFSAAVLFALAAMTCVILRPLMPIDETRYVSAAWEIYNGGSALVPHLNGVLYTHKPPLLFWLIDLVWLAGGVSTLAARLVAPAFAVASVLLTGILARRLWPQEEGRGGRAALILAVSPVFLVFGSTTMFDSMLAVATLTGMLALWSAAHQGGRRAWLLLGIAIALGVYAKGPVILIHIMPAALTMPLWAGTDERPTARAWYRGIGLSLIVAIGLIALWLGPALILGGHEYRAEVLWRQSAGRMVSSFAHQRPVWFFLALLPLFLWPFGWTATGLAALRPIMLWRDAASRLVIIWFVSALVAFSLISGKQVHYLIPDLPALALLLSGAAAFRQGRPRDLWLALPVLAIGAAIIAAWLGLVPALTEMGFSLPFWAVLLGIAVMTSGIAGFLRLRAGLIGLAALPLALVLGAHFTAAPLLEAHYDVMPLARTIAPYEQAGIAITDSKYNAQFNYAARLTSPIAQVTDEAQVADWVASHPGGVLLSSDEISVPGMVKMGVFPYRDKSYTVYRRNEGSQ